MLKTHPTYKELEAKVAELKTACWRIHSKSVDYDAAKEVLEELQEVHDSEVAKLCGRITLLANENLELTEQLAETVAQLEFAERLIFKAFASKENAGLNSVHSTLRAHNDRICAAEDELGLRAGYHKQHHVTDLLDE